MKTKEAKDFLVQQTAEQAAREHLPLSDIEKKMMYFTESDAASCHNPVELNDEFEAQCDTAEYEAKISRLLHHAYNRLKVEDPEGKRNWDEAISALRKGDHYFLVFWDLKPPSEHPTRDFFKLLRVGLLVAVGIAIATLVAVEYKIDLEHFRKYILLVVVGLFLLVTGVFRNLYRVAVVWFHSRTTEDDKPN
jgi:hypothetical protein